MNIKIKLTKKQLLNLTLFVAVIGVAALLDSYFGKNPVHLQEVGNNSNDKHNEPSTAYLFSQFNIPGAKVELQKPTIKKLQPKLNARFIQKYYQVRNYQVLKAEVKLKHLRLLTYHYLAFKNYFFSVPDDLPLIS